MPDVYRHAETVCPQCGHPLSALSQAGGVVQPGQPEPGDLSICVQCRSILEISAIGAYRVLTPAELATLDDDTRLDLEATLAFLAHYDSWQRQRRDPDHA